MIQETQHTIAKLPEKARRAKVFSKQDFACASREQKEKFKKSGIRAGIDESSCSREIEKPAAKKGNVKKWESAKTRIGL